MTRPFRHWFVTLMMALSLGSHSQMVFAVEPSERLPNPALEARARALSASLRCLVCQNESIDESNASLAHDLRLIVRQRLQAGDSDPQILRFMTERYGDFILLRPPFKPQTLALWLGPVAILLAGIVIAWHSLRRRQKGTGPPPPLTAEERRILATLDPTDGKAP